MSDFVTAALAVWPWWSGALLAVWWASLYESLPREPREGDDLAFARGCVVALTIVATLVWVAALILWLAGAL